MKKDRLLFLVFFSLCTALQLNAQLKVGVKTGYVKSSTDYLESFFVFPNGNDITEVSTFGLLAYYQINKYVAIGLESSFARRIFWVQGFEGQIEYTLNMIDYAIMLNINVPIVEDDFRIIGGIGVGPSFVHTAYNEEFGFFAGSRRRVRVKNNASFEYKTDGLQWNIGLARDFGPNQLFIRLSNFIALENTGENARFKSIFYDIGYVRSIDF